MDDASIRLARVEDWLRLARSGCLGDHLVRCTWSQVADDIEFYVYPERSPADDEADPSREDVEQAEAATGVGLGPAQSERSPDGELTCSNCDDPIVPLDASNSIVATGGWCAPEGTIYPVVQAPPLCSDCSSRMVFIAEMGFDPGRKGENLKMPRGGFSFTYPDLA